MNNKKIKKRNIAFFTTSRADFGQLVELIQPISRDNDIDYKLFVGGSHLADEYGKTISEIEDSEIEITAIFDYLLNGDEALSLTHSAGLATYELASIFKNYDFDFVCILGDRFELLSIVTAALIFCKPIIHISGGEVSEGALDNQVRHMITKAAHIHFASCDIYADNIRKMGEKNTHVFNHGVLALEAMTLDKLLTKNEVFNNLSINTEKQTVLLTYHPVTLEKTPVEEQMKNIFKVLDKFDFQVVLSAPNIEVNREKILRFIQKKVAKHRNYHFFHSLGSLNYNSLIPHCKMVIGNSSSGMLQVPFLRVPTINIGERQKGRIRHLSVIDTGNDIESITKGINKALDKNFLDKISEMEFIFSNGNVAEKMIDTIKSIDIDFELLQKKLYFE